MDVSKSVNFKTYIRELFRDRVIRLSPLDLEKSIRNRYPQTSRIQARAVIRRAVSEGLLAYCQQYATTYLILSPPNSIPASAFTILPASAYFQTSSDRIFLFLNDGVAFGSGEHPTTRLCLQGLEFAIRHIRNKLLPWPIKALDLGTGSGILAIAAVLLGIEQVVAVDIDPVACYEAKANAAINRVAEKIGFVTGTLECIGKHDFYVVLINLRTPTLVHLLSTLISELPAGVLIILSGSRPEEKSALQVAWLPMQLQERWLTENRGWAAVVLEYMKQ